MKSLQKIKKNEIKVFKRKTFKDERGFFTKLFDLEDYFGSILILKFIKSIILIIIKKVIRVTLSVKTIC